MGEKLFAEGEYLTLSCQKKDNFLGLLAASYKSKVYSGVIVRQHSFVVPLSNATSVVTYVLIHLELNTSCCGE